MEMLFNSKEKLLERGAAALSDIYDEFTTLETLRLDSFNPTETVLIAIDIVNGFLKAGAMADTSIAGIVPHIKEMMTACCELKIPILAFADGHNDNAVEFEAFPKHCVKGSDEANLIDELAEFTRYDAFSLFEKNSTNGYQEEAFSAYIADHPQLKNFIVVGDCTDICILQFCQTLKADFNRRNKQCTVILPLTAVETYNAEGHDADFMNVVALKLMQNTGIKLVKGLEK